jgi:DNA anti-recombination protein RmuC
VGTKLQDASAAFSRVARDFQAVIDLQAELARIGDIESAAENTSRRLAQAQADLSEAKGQLEKAKADTLRAADEARQKIEGAEAEKLTLIESGRKEVEKMISEATSTINAELAENIAACDAMLKKTEEAIENRRKKDAEEAEARATKLASLKAKVDETNKLLVERTGQLEAVEKRLAEVHQSVGQTLAGA